MKRDLPAHVYPKGRKGYLYFTRGGKTTRMHSEPGTAAFAAEYARLLRGEDADDAPEIDWRVSWRRFDAVPHLVSPHALPLPKTPDVFPLAPEANPVIGIDRETRKEIRERDGGRCRYCNRPARGFDHIFPLSRGGDDRKENLVVACFPCNGSKGARLLYTEWVPPAAIPEAAQ